MNELNQLKNKINDVCKDLSESGEESIFVTVNIEQTTCFVMGSDIGLKWLDSQSTMIQDFFRYVSGSRLKISASSNESPKKENENLNQSLDEETNEWTIKEEITDPSQEPEECLKTGTVQNTETEQTGDFIYTATKQQIIEWSFQETKTFYEQVKKHGYGNWNIIKEELNTSRTVEQLKEWWKIMIKDQSLMQEFNFGKIKKLSVKLGEDSDETVVNEASGTNTLKHSVSPDSDDSDITKEGTVKFEANTLSGASEDEENIVQKDNRTNTADNNKAVQDVLIGSSLNQEHLSPMPVTAETLPVIESTNSLILLANTVEPSSENRTNKVNDTIVSVSDLDEEDENIISPASKPNTAKKRKRFLENSSENKRLRVQVNSSKNKDANTKNSTESLDKTANRTSSTNDDTQHASSRPRRTPKPKKLFNMECYVKLENINKMNVTDLINRASINEPRLKLLESCQIKKESEEETNLSLQMSKSVTVETKENMDNPQDREDLNADIRSVEIDPTFLVQSDGSSENDVIEESEEIPKKKLKSIWNSKDESMVTNKKMFLENHKNNIRSRIKRARKREDGHIPCPTCDLMFSTSKGLKRHVRVCQVIKCPQCNEEFTSLEELEEHLEVHEGEELQEYQCRYCDMQFPLKSQLREHEKSHDELKDQYKFRCPLCPKIYTVGTSLRHHLKDAHKESRICCLVCRKFYDSEFDYNQHMGNHHQTVKKKVSPFSCKKCGKTFEQLYHLKRHNRYFHNAVGERICKLCLKICKDKEEYQEHIKEHEWDKPNMCSFCRVPFPSKAELEEHVRDTHDKGVRYMCEVCGFQASCALDMKHHKYEHDDSMPHTCEVCGKGFTLKSKLKSHMINHQDEMPFVCEVCGKKFKRRSTLRSHSFVHSEGMKCRFCEKVFRSIGGCDYHIVRVHSHLVNVDNYKKNLVKCEECDKYFPSKYSYDQHQIKHLKEKAWMCHICGKKFKTQAQLDKHKPNHELVKPFYCQCCGSAFITQSRLDAHVKTDKHKENMLKSQDPLTQSVYVQQTGVLQQEILNQDGGSQQQGITQPFLHAKKAKKTVSVLKNPRRLAAAVTKDVNGTGNISELRQKLLTIKT
ncbi:PR domain zinc finger protein 5-like isoform X2 [Mytilus trossulus]|uniref:PR domain zinc finger protein 5-like isoform X2 n=1 Tax=Mytilus trossulus TaxID=6551 RepID=UPI003004CC96